MSQKSKKRSRKAKLVPRTYDLEDVRDEDVDVSTSVKELSSQLLRIKQEIDNEDFDSVQNNVMSPFQNYVVNPLQNYMTPSQNCTPSPMQFSIKVEVEECDEQDLNIKEEIITDEENEEVDVTEIHDSMPSISDFDISKEAESLLVKAENIDLVPNISEEYFNSPIELKYDTSQEPINDAVKVVKKVRDKRKDEKYLVFPEEILKYQPDPNDVAAKMLFIEVRNILGRTVKEDMKTDPHDSLIQQNLWQLKFGHYNYLLMYKCYICTKAWWHLYPFREHIRQHNDVDFMVNLEPNKGMENNMIAYKGDIPSYKDIEIDSNCWLCGKAFSTHINPENSPNFTCFYCSKKFHTCSLLAIHEGLCFQEMLRKAIAKWFLCPYCPVLTSSETDLNDHLVLRHSVRCDVPMTPIFKFCPYCNGKYFNFYLHVCPKRTVNRPCLHCKRKFPNKILWDAHVSLSKNNVQCPICGYIVAKECVMTEHLLEKHSTDFTACKKCILCSDFIVVLSEDAERDHRLLYHKVRFDHRRGRIFETVLIPNTFLIKPHEGPPDITPKTLNKFVINPRTSSVTLDIASKSLLKSLEGPVTQKTINKLVVKPNTPSVTQVTAGKSLLKPLEGPTQKTINKVVVKPNTPSVTLDTAESLLKPQEGPVTQETIKNVVVQLCQPETEPEKLMDVSDKSVTENPVIKIELSDSDTEEPDCETIITTNEISYEDNIKTEPSEFEEDNYNMNVSNIKTELEDVDIESNTADYEQLLSNVFRVSENFSNMRDEVKVEVQPIEEEVNDENLNLETLEPEVILKSGYRKRRIYTCRKCGFKNFHREFKLHINNKCEPVKEIEEEICSGYACTKCNKSFGSMKKYVLHFTNHGYDNLTCPECFKKIDTPALLTGHVTSHVRKSYVKLLVICRTSMQKNVLQCKKCKGKVIAANFFAHWESHFEIRQAGAAGGMEEYEGGSVSTALDPETLMEIINLLTYNERGQISSAKVVRNCNVCHRHFERVNDCKRHLIEHLLADAYASRPRNIVLKCQICCIGLRKADEYKQHMRDHGSLPVYKCEPCDKTFSDSSNFTKHKKIHNLKVLVCDICGKKFQAKISIIKHIEMHQTTDPIKCGLCPRVFYTASEYKKHYRSCHDKTKPKFKCLICSKKFLYLKDKWDHMWVVHKERKVNADCPVCRRSFRKYSEVKAHVKKMHGMGVSVFKMKLFNSKAKKQMAEALQKSLMNEMEDDKTDDETLIVF